MKPRLALHGGPPVRQERLPYGRQWIDESDVEAVVAVLRGDWLTQGPNVGAFEAAFAAAVGVRHAVAFANGTAALHAACFAAGLGPGDEAVVPAITFVATANAATYLGARPVFADVDPASGLVTPDAVCAALTPRTKAVLPVHYAGLPVDLDAVLSVARERGLTVIVDACHALGARYRGEPIGRFGDLVCFSFHPVKHITTGEGGMVTTDDAGHAARLRAFRSHGIYREPDRLREVGPWHNEMLHLGFNYRLTDLQAALGASQLRRLPEFVARRRELAAAYDAAFAGRADVAVLPTYPDRACSYHLYPLLFAMDRLTCDKATLFAALTAEGIGVQVHYGPVPAHGFYRERGYTMDGLPGAAAFYAREISLPLFPAMTAADRDSVVAAVEKVLAALGA